MENEGKSKLSSVYHVCIGGGESVVEAGSSPSPARQRLISIDALRGLVMVLMLVDHVRETVFLHQQVGDPVAADTTSPALFFTRLLSGFCAPAFIFLAGTGAWLYGQKHSPSEVSGFLLKRGIFLILLELFVIGTAWTGVFPPERFYLQVIWCIGLCMVILAGLIHLPRLVLGGLAFFLMAGHHPFDGIHATSDNWWHPIWAVIYQRDWIELIGIPARTSYPILPWVGVIAFGYLIGPLFHSTFKVEQRSRHLIFWGIGLLVSFLLIRTINLYGDQPWRAFSDPVQTLMSYLSLTKYPPSLLFLLFTLAPAFFALLLFEKYPSNSLVSGLARFGSAPLFFYILHLYLLKLIYVILVSIYGKNQGDYYGVDHVWGIWLWSLAILPILWFATCYFARFKQRHRDWQWLKYF